MTRLFTSQTRASGVRSPTLSVPQVSVMAFGDRIELKLGLLVGVFGLIAVQEAAKVQRSAVTGREERAVDVTSEWDVHLVNELVFMSRWQRDLPIQANAQRTPQPVAPPQMCRPRSPRYRIEQLNH